MNYSRSVLGSISGGVFLIGLALAFYLSSSFNGDLFLPVLFVTIGFTSLLGAASSGNAKGIYGGIQGFVWMIGLASCFYFGFWPWILVVCGVSAILGALIKPITEGLFGLGVLGLSAATRANPQPQPTYQPYQQGYQPPQQPTETYQEGGQQYNYPPSQYEQPQVQYPQQQELPPQQQ